jgi:hypothetical protein
LADQADNTLDILESRIDRHLGPVVDAAGEFARQFADGRLNLDASRTNTFHAFSGALSSNSQMTAILFIRADGKSITFTRLEGYPLEVQPTQQILERRITGFPYWYHRIKLTDGVITPGWAPIDAASYRIPDDLTGKCVLDIGAWDGYWSFEALRRGADQVVAIDDFSDYVGHLETKDRKAWETFDLCREALGYDEDRCQRH